MHTVICLFNLLRAAQIIDNNVINKKKNKRNNHFEFEVLSPIPYNTQKIMLIYRKYTKNLSSDGLIERYIKNWITYLDALCHCDHNFNALLYLGLLEFEFMYWCRKKILLNRNYIIFIQLLIICGYAVWWPVGWYLLLVVFNSFPRWLKFDLDRYRKFEKILIKLRMYS